jgi:hypothetical protein
MVLGHGHDRDRGDSMHEQRQSGLKPSAPHAPYTEASERPPGSLLHLFDQLGHDSPLAGKMAITLPDFATWSRIGHLLAFSGSGSALFRPGDCFAHLRTGHINPSRACNGIIARALTCLWDSAHSNRLAALGL